MSQNLNFKYVDYFTWTESDERGRPRNKKIKKDVNNDDLVISSARVVLEVNEREKVFKKL